MDFIIGVPPIKSIDESTYDAILVVVDRFSKINRYVPYTKTINALGLAFKLIREVYAPFGMLKSIVTNCRTLFTLLF